jgi:hypothetical protein
MMKKGALLVTLLVFAVGVLATASFSGKPAGDVPDVTGNYSGTNTRFYPDILEVETGEARFYIWDQEGRHFWGSVNSKTSRSNDEWTCAGYINGVILPDNTIYFVNYGANYNGDPPYFIGNAFSITYAKFFPAKGNSPKKFETITVRPFTGSSVTSIGTYINRTTDEDICVRPSP